VLVVVVVVLSVLILRAIIPRWSVDELSALGASAELVMHIHPPVSHDVD
jgi:hypothetical protein